MCGFYGKWSPKSELGGNPTEEFLSDYLIHRGPDDSGRVETENFFGQHFRLSILDLSHNAHQPMQANDATLIFNGEIYNYRELANELKSKWKFKSESDTEVLLAELSLNGTKNLNKLRGMFSFAFYDAKKDKLILSRDHAGQKPLYYFEATDGSVSFSSSAKLLSDINQRSSSHTSGRIYRIMQAQIPGKTMFSAINEILPGTHTEFGRNGKVTYHFFTQPSFRKLKFDKVELSEILNNAVGRTLVSDVPIAAYLSGGLDSSLVVGIAKRSGYELDCFHAGYDYPGFSEVNFAREVADQNKIKIHEQVLRKNDFLFALSHFMKKLEYPMCGPGSTGQFLLAKNAGTQYKVALAGQGGDELFGGYGRYLPLFQYSKELIPLVSSETYLSLFQQFKPVIESHYKIMESISKYNFPVNFLRAISVFVRNLDSSDTFQYFLEEVWAFLAAKKVDIYGESAVNLAMLVDTYIYLPSLLHVEDRMSMSFSVESRLPLVDFDLMSYALSLSPTEKFAHGLKTPLKEVSTTYIPRSVLTRRDKNGFTIPLNQWLQDSQFTQDLSLITGIDTLDFTQNLGVANRNLWSEISIKLFNKEQGVA